MRALLMGILLVLGTVFASPALARGAKIEVQILDLSSPDAIENAKALSIALERAVTRADGWTLAPGDYSLEVLTAALDCSEPPDAACLEKIAGQIECDRFIWGTVARAGENVVAELHLWNQGDDLGKTSVTYSANLDDAADDALLAIAQKTFAKLLGVAAGTVAITAGTGAGTVSIDGKASGALVSGLLEVEVPAGDHEVLVEVAGFRDARRRFTMTPGERVAIELDLVAVEAPVTEPEPARRERRPLRPRQVLGLGLVGLGGATLITGGVLGAMTVAQRDDAEFSDYRDSVPAGEDTCDVADARGDTEIVDKCDANLATRRMALILAPAGAAVAAVGVALVATARPRETTSRRPGQPTAALTWGPRGAGVRLTVDF